MRLGFDRPDHEQDNASWCRSIVRSKSVATYTFSFPDPLQTVQTHRSSREDRLCIVCEGERWTTGCNNIFETSPASLQGLWDVRVLTRKTLTL